MPNNCYLVAVNVNEFHKKISTKFIPNKIDFERILKGKTQNSLNFHLFFSVKSNECRKVNVDPRGTHWI